MSCIPINHPPTQPTNPVPSDGATNVSLTPKLSWTASDPDGDILTFDVYLGTDSNDLKMEEENLTSKSYKPDTLNSGTKYYWKVVAKDGKGGKTEGPVWSFTTLSPALVQGFVLPFVGDITTNFAQNKIFKANPLKADIQTTSNSKEHPAPEVVPNQFVVKVKSGKEINKAKQDLHSQNIVLNNANVKAKKALVSRDNSFSYILIESSSPLIELKKQLSSFSWFESIEPNYNVKAFEAVVPNDEYYSFQWHYETIKVPYAWNVTTGSIDVVVAVLDTGVRFDHPDLEGIFFSTGYDFIDDDNDPVDPGNPDNPSEPSHGTHVIGTIAALTNNNEGVAGVTWGTGNFSTKILPVRVLGSDGSGSDFQVAQGIIYAVEHGAKVINMSLGGPTDSSIIHDAVKYAYNNDVVIVCAAGNDASDKDYEPWVSYPAAYPETIAVGAVRWDLTRARYSNYGHEIDVVAPGGDMTVDQNNDGYEDGVLSTSWSLEDGNGYWFFQGTSMAAPHVTGVIALMMSAGISGVEEIRNILHETAYDLGDSGFDWEYGYGLVNAYKAVTAYKNWEPLLVYSVDPVSEEVDSVTIADEDGSYSLLVNIPEAEIYVWRDFDHDGTISYGDLYGYYGYVGGDPLSGNPEILTVTPEELLTLDLFFAPLVDTTTRPLADYSLQSVQSFKGFEKVLMKKKIAIEEYYNKREP